MGEGTDQQWLCHGCVGEEFLKSRINAEGTRHKCSFCSHRRNALTLDKIADAFDEAFEQHLYRTSDEPSDYEYLLLRGESSYDWERSGDPVLEVLQEIGEIEEDVAEAIRRVLNGRHSSYDSQEEDEFDEGSHYKYRSVKTRELSADWNGFTAELKKESRYFNKTASAVLTNLFQGIDKYKSVDGRTILVKAGPETEYASLYRARVFQDASRLREALERPDLHIGPPPFRLASAGRLNARGISVFYGATSRETALSEVRPFVGSRVISAEFELTRQLVLLDIEALESLEVIGSYFDPSYLERLQKAKFLASLSRRMTQPVMPDDEPFEYLPTQAIADFLSVREKPRVDGLIYPSVQNQQGMKNVVLFHKASLLDEMVFPKGTEIHAQLETTTEDGSEPDYCVWEETPNPNEKSDGDVKDEGESVESAFSRLEDDREAALKLVPSSVKVHYVEKIDYKVQDFSVARHRLPKQHYSF